jgi:hypothetical protein
VVQRHCERAGVYAAQGKVVVRVELQGGHRPHLLLLLLLLLSAATAVPTGLAPAVCTNPSMCRDALRPLTAAPTPTLLSTAARARHRGPATRVGSIVRGCSTATTNMHTRTHTRSIVSSACVYPRQLAPTPPHPLPSPPSLHLMRPRRSSRMWNLCVYVGGSAERTSVASSPGAHVTSLRPEISVRTLATSTPTHYHDAYGDARNSLCRGAPFAPQGLSGGSTWREFRHAFEGRQACGERDEVCRLRRA